jgi:FkbH-like protein
MSKIKYSEIIAENKRLKKEVKGNLNTVGLISNITINQLKEVFEYTCRNEGINVKCSFGNYDNIMQDSSLFKDSKIVIIFWELANIIDGLQYKADLMEEDMLMDLISKVKNELNFVFESLKTTPQVLINKFSSLIFNFNNLEKNKFDKIADELNSYLIENKPANFKIIETDKIIAQLSVERSTDLRYFYSSKALYSIDFYKSWSSFVLPIVRSLNGKMKKALIFDCDNTLWKGVLGEEGFDNIILSSNQSGGAPYEEVQSIAKKLIKDGIILGICSKNNPEDVHEVLTKHTKMTLSDDDFTIKKVNWTDKPSNIESIAKTLNIGKDSLVFVDDSNFEINFVKGALPDVTTIQVPEKISEYPKVIRQNLGLFYNVSTTPEDIKRIRMYKEQIKREEASVGFKNLESYIKSLSIKLQIHIDDSSIIPRMSQMTQKTNQFNLTTKRYSEADIKSFVDSEIYSVISVGVMDKFGDNGITALAIIKKNDKTAKIDTFLMSCRIIGRNIEYSFFDYLINFLKQNGIKEVSAKYHRTLKNDQVSDFYDNLGFSLVNKINENKHYVIKVNNYKPHLINYININDGE